MGPWEGKLRWPTDVCTLGRSTHPRISIVWREGLRHALGLSRLTHTALLAPVAGFLPLKDCFSPFGAFVWKHLLSENSFVLFVSWHGIYFFRATAKHTHGIAVEIRSVRPSVCLYIRQKRVLWQNEST